MMFKYLKRTPFPSKPIILVHRGYSTTQKVKGSWAAKIKELFKTPITKSILLTLIFGTAVVDLMKSRKDLDNLVRIYESKFCILEEIIQKLENGENVDINQELKIANTLTKYKYNTVTDIELDEQLDKFLSMSDTETSERSETSQTSTISKGSIDTNKFL